MVFVNHIVQPTSDCGFESSRVVYISRTGEHPAVFLVPLHRQQLPIKCDLVALETAVRDKKALLVVDNRLLREKPRKAPRYFRIRDAAWTRIEPLVSGETRFILLDKAARRGLISARARDLIATMEVDSRNKKQLVASMATQIHRDLYRYYKYGSTKDALFPDYKSVAPGSEQPDGQKKRGAKPDAVKRGERRNGPPLTKLDRTAIKGILTYGARPGRTKDDLFEDVIDQLCSLQVIKDGLTTTYVHRPIEEQFTKAQVFRQFDRCNISNALTKKMTDPDDWASNCRGTTACAHHGVYGPGQMYQVDWTGTNVTVVSADNSRIRFKPAIIYFVVDVWSKMIVGFYVTLQGASWDGISLALFNAAQDKVSFCKTFGKAITTAEWPARGLPMGLDWDRGPEATGHSSNAAIFNLFCDSKQSPRRRPRWHSIVENTNRSFKSGLSRHLSGYQPGKAGKGSKKYRGTPCLTLHDLIVIVIEWILKFNRHCLSKIAVPDIAIAAAIKQTPLALWNWGMKHAAPGLREVDPKQLYISLLPEVDGRIDRDGLHIRGFRYSAPELVDADVFSSARRAGCSTPVKARVDPTPPTQVWLAFNRTFIRCRRTDEDSIFATYGFEDIDAEDNAFRATGRHIDEENRQPDSNTRSRIKGIERRARARTRAAKLGSVDRQHSTDGLRKEEGAKLAAIHRANARDQTGLPDSPNRKRRVHVDHHRTAEINRKLTEAVLNRKPT